jgi:hypothetical protein
VRRSVSFFYLFYYFLFIYIFYLFFWYLLIQTEESTKVFTDVVQALASELFTPHPTVRKNVQSSLEQLAELTGHEVD